MKIMWVLIMMAGIVSPVLGAPLAPPLSSSNPTAGETAMLSSGDQCSAYVDWMVLTGGSYASTDFEALVKDVFGGSTDIPMGQYLYAYKVESLVDNGGAFSVNLADSSFVADAGTSDMNLDDVGHNDTNFANLGPPPPEEFTFTDKQPIVAVGDPILDGSNLTWSFDGGLDAGQESAVMWFVSDSTPSYRPASFLDDLNGDIPCPDENGDGIDDTIDDTTDENCDDENGDLTPVPAPGALLLGAIGLGLVNWIKRRLA